MVKSVIDGVTTYYVGGYYELRVEGTVETEVKYYYAASRRIAIRTITSSTDTLHWLISDHEPELRSVFKRMRSAFAPAQPPSPPMKSINCTYS